jgi:hypothetical protein
MGRRLVFVLLRIVFFDLWAQKGLDGTIGWQKVW